MTTSYEKKLIDDFEFYNDKSKQYFIEKTFGIKNHQEGGKLGSCSSKINDNIFSWTMQKYNDNQKTLSEELKGGRVSLPKEYFGTNTGSYKDLVKSTNISDSNNEFSRLGMNSTLKGGELTIRDFNKFLKDNKNVDINNKIKKSILNEYNQNIEKFINTLKMNGGKKITKKSINNAFKNLI